MEVILDSSFIISCARDRIDFLTQLEEQGFKIIVPREVMQEMKDLRLRKGGSHEDRIAIDVALDMISNSKRIKKVGIGNGKVDEALIKKGKTGAYIATLDKEIKRQVPNRVVIFSAQGKVGIE
jgi:rRNA-processing protein FCF1